MINCVLKHENKILVVKRSKENNIYPGLWNGVSGFLDDRKSLEEKVYEEIWEEAGIKKKNIISIKLGKIFDQEDKKFKKTWVVHPISIRVKTNEIKLDWEAQEYKWLDQKEIGKLKLMPGFRQVLENLPK